MTRHVDTQRWIDAARGLLPESERASAEEHAASCTACRRAGSVFSGFAALARTEDGYDVPEDVVRRALDLFPALEKPNAVERLLATLVFDGASMPLPAGVRTGLRPDQRLYHAGDYALDLQVTSERSLEAAAGSAVVVVGQIASRAKPGPPLSGRPVLLLAGLEVVARTLSNERGEFHLECAPRNGMRLQVWVGGDRKIEVPVSRFTEVHS
jgi:hypothetical protein